MKIKTTVLGEVEIDERQVFDFPCGLLGLPELTRFALIDSGHPPYFYLQALTEPYLSFAVMSPEVFRPDYRLDVDEADLLPLDMEPGSLDRDVPQFIQGTSGRLYRLSAAPCHRTGRNGKPACKISRQRHHRFPS